MNILGVDMFFQITTTFYTRQGGSVKSINTTKTLEEAQQLRKDKLSDIYEKLKNSGYEPYYISGSMIVDLRDVSYVACTVEDYTPDTKTEKKLRKILIKS